jgi:predicted O-methyltransferase YrrM
MLSYTIVQSVRSKYNLRKRSANQTPQTETTQAGNAEHNSETPFFNVKLLINNQNIVRIGQGDCMFHEIPQAIKDRMIYLEKLDEKDRTNGKPKLQRLRQVPQETGKFLALMLACSPEGTALEIGTSAGYSTLWLALACMAAGRQITTFEILDEKVKLAKETFQQSGVEDVVKLVKGDARKLIGNYNDISFCFLDCEKEYYLDCYERLVPRMVKGGILIADNVINHAADLQQFLDKARNDERVDSVIVPYKSGELLCRKT